MASQFFGVSTWRPVSLGYLSRCSVSHRTYWRDIRPIPCLSSSYGWATKPTVRADPLCGVAAITARRLHLHALWPVHKLDKSPQSPSLWKRFELYGGYGAQQLNYLIKTLPFNWVKEWVPLFVTRIKDPIHFFCRCRWIEESILLICNLRRLYKMKRKHDCKVNRKSGRGTAAIAI